MSQLLESKVAIVTGAGRGIGRGEALLLAKKGAKVVVNDVGGGFDGEGEHHGPADDIVEEIRGFGGEAVPNYDSVVDFQAAKRIIDTAISSFGKLDILVNNAGILRDRMIFNMTEEEWDAVLGVHLKGTFNCTRHVCAYWREQQKAGKPVEGRIINTVSDAGLVYNPGQSNYGAAKAGIAAFTLIVAKEMAKYGVTSNVVVPMARTRLTTDATPSLAPLMGTPEDMKKKIGFDVLDPDNIAPLVVYLASDDAKDITGQVFRIIGGTVWLLESWRSFDKIMKPSRWTPEELGPKVKELLNRAPERENLQIIIKDLGIF
ncbi:MAG: SDR family oxidoreductase [Candidatus Bathyarchaeota archaeon]|nr:SDR family oxidoreductase [Candidatus Bathyarchaeota archaeon]